MNHDAEFLLRQRGGRYQHRTANQQLWNWKVHGAPPWTLQPGPVTKGKSLSDEHKEKIRKAALGKTHSKETKIKMSNSAKGKKKTQEHKNRLSESRKKYIVSDETRKKLSKAGMGRKHSNETKIKMSESQKKRFLNRKENK